jgi:hypothetical protein
MGDSTNDTFFGDVPAFSEFAGVTDMANYRSLPDDWALITGDIVNSTGAIAAGNYKTVNMSGASIISAVLNALDHQDLPFVFGGDGALVAVPASGIEKARAAVAAVRTWAREEMGLEMRAALIPVKDIRQAGFDVRVARFRVSDYASFAMFSGGGASWADARMKAGQYLVEPAPPSSRPDLTGLSCRWSPIPSRHGQVVSVIAVPIAGADASAFTALIADIVSLVAGEERGAHPVPQEGPLAGRLNPKAVDWEARAQAPMGKRAKEKLKIMAQFYLAKFLDRFDITLGDFDPKRYRRDVAANSDFRKFDDGLKMTIDVDAESLGKIEARLEQASNAGVCRYGLHRQDAALMTCLVMNPMKRDHMHFIDGAAGGYTLAATHLKAKIKAAAAAAATATATP